MVPVYNECDHIESLLKEWVTALQDAVQSFEIVVINDGSSDGTGRVLDRLRHEIKTLRVIHQLNSGHGRAVRRGYELSRGKYILQLDSNGRYEPSDFLRLWEEKAQAHLVLAHRTHRLDSLIRRSFSSFLKRSAKWLFSIELQDPDVAFRLFERKPVLHYLSGLSPSWDSVNLAMSIILKREMPDRVKEIKIPFRKRPKGETYIGPTALAKLASHYLQEMIRLRFTMVSIRILTSSSTALPIEN